jgi:hypothetical protein
MTLLRALVALGGIVLLGCSSSDRSCASACDRAKGCGFSTSGLSCDGNCAQGSCAACVNEKTCDEIAAGSCAVACPGVSFTKK